MLQESTREQKGEEEGGEEAEMMRKDRHGLCFRFCSKEAGESSGNR